MHDTLAPVSIKHLLSRLAILTLITLDSRAVEKLIEHAAGFDLLCLSKGVPGPLAGGNSYKSGTKT